MSDLIRELFALANAPLSVFMIAMILYWLLTAFGIFDMDNFDVDVDLDMDMDIDADIDAEIDDFSGTRGEDIQEGKPRKRRLNLLEVFLIYFHFVEVPFMMAFTIFIFFWWSLNFMFTSFFNAAHHWGGFVYTAMTLVPALFIMKLFTYPLKGIMRKLNPRGVDSIRLEGRVGQSITVVSDEKIGQIQLVVDESPIRVYAKCINKGQKIEANQEILIIKKSADSKFYLIDSNL